MPRGKLTAPPLPLVHAPRERLRRPLRCRRRDELVRAMRKTALEKALREMRTGTHQPRAIRELRIEQVAYAALVGRRSTRHARLMQCHQYLTGGVGVARAEIE